MNDHVAQPCVLTWLGGVTSRTLATFIRDEGFPPPRLALTRKTKLWHRADIEAWLAERERKQTVVIA